MIVPSWFSAITSPGTLCSFDVSISSRHARSIPSVSTLYSRSSRGLNDICRTAKRWPTSTLDTVPVSRVPDSDRPIIITCKEVSLVVHRKIRNGPSLSAKVLWRVPLRSAPFRHSANPVANKKVVSGVVNCQRRYLMIAGLEIEFYSTCLGFPCNYSPIVTSRSEPYAICTESQRASGYGYCLQRVRSCPV